jgi:four helix bundle protein
MAESMDLVSAVYAMVRELPEVERFGLAAQLRRSAVSVAVNIAEGQGRKSDREFRRYVSIAQGSICEVETEVLIAIRLEYVSEEQTLSLMELASETGRLLAGLHRSLSRDNKRQQST